MATLKQEILFFNDEFGRTRPGAKIFTYAAGTTTQKATYTDSDLANANPWPVVADGAGIFPPIYLGTGGYRVVVKDQNDVQLYDRDNLNIADTSVITTSYLVFDNLVDAKQGILIDGQSISPQVGQAVKTVGLNTSTDGIGGEWIVVAPGTGTPDDDLFADLDNGNQIQRLFNCLYTSRLFSEIASAGASAQSDARDNIDVYSRAEAIEDAAGTVATANLASEAVTTAKIASESVTNAKIADDAVLSEEIGERGLKRPTAAGTVTVNELMDVSEVSTTSGTYESPVFRPRFNTSRTFSGVSIRDGACRIVVSIRSSSVSETCVVRLYRNGVDLGEVSTNSTTTVQQFYDITIEPGDVINVQFKSLGGSVNPVFLSSVAVKSNAKSPAIV